MSQGSRDLDGSWVVNDADDGDVSWAGESSPSETEEEVPVRPIPRSSPRGQQRATPKKSPIPAKVATPEPQFIMPSIDASFSQPRQRHTSQRSSARSTPQRQGRPRVKDNSFSDPNAYGAGSTSSRLSDVGISCLFWLLDTLGKSLKILQFPIAIVVAICIVLITIQLIVNFATNSISRALSPVCRIPGIGLFDLAMCKPYGEPHLQLPAGSHVPDPEFDALMKVQSHFETIMADTAESASLPMDMKRSEISIRDLRQLVKFSQLPSKHELEHELDGFVETARIASYDLQKFDSHVGRSVDKVLSTNKWTRRVLDDIDLQRSERGILPAFISDTLLVPFQPLKFTESRLLDQYIQHSHIVSGEIETLIEEAQALLQVLQNLEDRLDVMHSISTHDNIQIQGSKDEVLRELLSYVGLNRAKLGKHDNQLKLLGMVSGYRRAALNHVTRTLIHLQSMGTELEELRERIASPGLARDAGLKQIPLSVHIENIQLGVERLESGRERAKELQNQQTRKVLDRAEAGGGGDVKYISSGG